MDSCEEVSNSDALIKESLNNFLDMHLSDASFSQIDEILMSYIINVIKENVESYGNDDDKDSNIETFTETLEAYIPGFANVTRNVVHEWMKNLSSSTCEESEENSSTSVVALHEIPQISNTIAKKKKSVKLDEKLATTEEVIGGEIMKLTEMFPDACKLELRHCLELSNGDLEGAAQLVLHRQEIGDTLSSSQPTVSKSNQTSILDDKKVKDSIIAKYSYVDSSDDVKEHKPIMPKMEPKKLIRYRENKIVSMKGERFSDVKKDETEEMKKTYINLKPAKQYRFH